MRLTLEDGTKIVDPTDAQIEEALGKLNWLIDNSFAILGEEWNYIQTAQEDSPEHESPFFILEYQDGFLDKHYRAADGPIALGRVVQAFRQYARGDLTWRVAFNWERMDLSE